jgi:hypothetical protein
MSETTVEEEARKKAEREKYIERVLHSAKHGHSLMGIDAKALAERVAELDQQLAEANARAETAERHVAEREQVLFAVIRRCREVFEHALQNVRSLTGGDEKRMRAMVDEINEELD